MTPEEIQKLKVKSGYALAIEVKPGLPVGPFREELVIQTDHPDQPEVKVTVVGQDHGTDHRFIPRNWRCSTS